MSTPGVSPVPEPKKRLLGISMISGLWAFGGLLNLCYAISTISNNRFAFTIGWGSIPIFNISDYYRKFGIPADTSLAAFNVVIGFGLLAAAYGLWMRKRWSYDAAVLMVWLPVIRLVLSTSIILGSPNYLHPSFWSIPVSFAGAALWVVIYLGYLRKHRVKEYLNVDSGPSQVLGTH
jgi:hypothetical protein